MENKEKMAVLGELKDSQEMFVYCVTLHQDAFCIL